MNSDMNPIDPDLERAISEIRDENPDPATVERAAAAVWQRISAPAPADPGHIRDCAGFQAIFAEYRAGTLPESKTLLVRDHLHHCVACRHIYEGKVAVFPSLAPKRVISRPRDLYRWAAAAAVLVAVGLSSWFAFGRRTAGPVRATVQTVNGALYAISASGVRPLAAGQDLPYGVEIRAAKESYALVRLRDGSTVEMRERSSFFTSQDGADETIHLGRGSVLVQAAKRSSGHLYVATADCRVAVTGTVFAVEAGTKGSRVSVIEGQVRVAQDNRETVLQKGGQAVTGPNLEQAPIAYNVSWSRAGERLTALPRTQQPGLRDELLERAPANTVFLARIPDLKAASDELSRLSSQDPSVSRWLKSGDVDVPRTLNAAAGYLDRAAVLGFAGPDNRIHGPVVLGQLKREGLREALNRTGTPALEKEGFAVFGGRREDVEMASSALGAAPGAFRNSPCYARLSESDAGNGAFALCADLAHFRQQEPGAPRYLFAEQSRARGEEQSRATLGFDGARTGLAAWLAAPAPMGSLEFISPDATFLAAFAVKNPASIVDESVALYKRSREEAQKSLAEAQQQTGIDVRNDLADALGGEFALAIDGPLFPTPSWKLVAEVYDPTRFQATIQKLIEAYNRDLVKMKTTRKPLATSQETAGGRTYYLVGSSDGNPLLQAQYTFVDGFVVAGPTRAVLTQALQTRTARTSITRAAKFVAMTPRDRYANFSAVLYQNMGTSLSPLVGLLGALAPQRAGNANSLQGLADLKSTFVAFYGEPDRISVAASGNLGGVNLSNLASGSLLGFASSALPLGRLPGTSGGGPAFR